MEKMTLIVHYFYDSYDENTPQTKILTEILDELISETPGLEYKLKTFSHCPLQKALADRFHILIVDYGALYISGAHDMAVDFSRELIRHAEDHPSRYYIIESQFSQFAVEEVKSENPGGVPANVVWPDYVKDYLVDRILASCIDNLLGKDVAPVGYTGTHLRP